MALVFNGNLPRISGNIKIEVPTPTYSGTASSNADDSINPYTMQGPGASGAGQTASEIATIRSGGSIGDPDFANVTFLMDMDGINGGTIFTELSQNDPVTVNGAVATTTSNFKFGTASATFPGTVGHFLEIPGDGAFGTGDMTVEGWFYRSGGGENQKPFNYSAPGDLPVLTGWLIQLSTPTFHTFFGGTLFSSNGLINDQWQHLAITRQGTVFRMFIDGIKTLESTSTQDISGGGAYKITVGNSLHSTTQPFSGQVDDLRVTKGVARYTENFTPPTAAFPTS